MIMKSYRVVFSLFLIGNVIVAGDVRKSPPYSVFSQVAASVGIFQSDHNGRIPKSWNELKEEGYLANELHQAAEKHLALEKRYGFFEKPIKINAGGRQLDLIALAVETGKEGDKTVKHPDGSSYLAPGRMAITLSPDYEFATSTHFTENQLQRIFTAAGLDLSDYTGNGGNWSNKEELQAASVLVPDAIRDGDRHDKHNLTQNYPDHNWNEKKIIAGKNKSIKYTHGWYWSSLVILVALLFACFVISRNRKKS